MTALEAPVDLTARRARVEAAIARAAAAPVLFVPDAFLEAMHVGLPGGTPVWLDVPAPRRELLTAPSVRQLL